MEGISQDAAASEHFTFVVGTSKRKFSIHSAIVAHQSQVLSTLVNGDFKEAVDRCVAWDDIDEHTFHSFWQYAYSGDYDVPDEFLFERQLAAGASGQDESAFESPVSPTVDEDGFLLTNPDRFLKKDKKKNTRRNGFKPPGSSPESDFRTAWRVDMTAHSTNRPQEDRKPKDAAGILTHHAKVYILADRYSITKLMDLSFHKPHQAVVGYFDEGHRIEGIVGVLRFCCAGDAPERLRQMMEHYAACNIKTLWGSEEFQELVEECGSLSRDIIGRLIPRIAY